MFVPANVQHHLRNVGGEESMHICIHSPTRPLCGPGGTDRLEVTRYTLAPDPVQEATFPGQESFC